MKKILSLILVLLMSFSLVCCGQNGSDSTTTSDTPPFTDATGTTNANPPNPVIEGKYIVLDGESEYSVLVAADASVQELEASSEFRSFFEEATGISLNVVKDDDFDPAGKYISFGNTSLFEDLYMTLNEDDLTLHGYTIITLGDNIYVVAAGSYGVLWGAYGLLSELFGYEYYAADCYTLAKDVDTLPLYELNVVKIPDIELHGAADSQIYYDKTVRHRMLQVKIDEEMFLPTINNYHNSFEYFQDTDGNIAPEFMGTSGQQLCFTAHGNADDYSSMVDIATDYLISLCEKSDHEYVMLGIMDGGSAMACTCEACMTKKAEYGSNLGVVIEFANNVHRKMETYFADNHMNRTLNIIVFAYNDYTLPPVKQDMDGKTYATIHTDDGVLIMYAPIGQSFPLSLYDEKNITYRTVLENLSLVTDDMYCWMYGTNFGDYLIPYDGFSYIQELYQAMEANNTVAVYHQGKHNAGSSTAFDIYRQYLVKKLSWDVDADMQQLESDFFEAYFGEASEPMHKFYEEMRMRLVYNHTYQGMHTGIYLPRYNEEYWPLATLNAWMEYIDEAYEAIAPLAENDPALYNTLYTRILRESIMPRYLLIRMYWYERSDIEELKEQFIADALMVGIARHKETGVISDVFADL